MNKSSFFQLNSSILPFVGSILILLLLLCLYVPTTQSAVLVKNKLWKKDTVLNVVFLDGNPKLHQLVKSIAPQWLQQTSLSFQFFSNLSSAPKQTHIRISFNLHSGSRLGNHQDYQSKTATMNLFDLVSNQTSDSGAQRLILHEFGHALGFEHEYRSSYWPYDTKVIEQIIVDCYPKMELIGYSSQTAKQRCQTINAPINSKLAYLTAYDEGSIMNYPMSFILKDGGEKNIKAAINLSTLDHYAIQLWYGK